MSQPKKKDIADFFRPHARVIPRKRATPEPDDDTIVVNTIFQRRNNPHTPGTTRVIKLNLAGSDGPSIARSPARPLLTPKSGRTLSIPIRSPSILSPAKRSNLFGPSDQPSQPSPKPFDPSSLSFADIPTSTRKVIEDGKLVAVQDSDDDNESLASLESLTDIFDRKKKATSSDAGVSNQSSKNEEERLRMLSMYTGGRTNPILNRENLRALQRRHQESKFDISFLVDEQQVNSRVDEKIKQANAEIAESTEEMERDKRDELDKKMLAAILKGTSDNQDPDDLARILNAIDRTEALSTEKTYSFFGRPNSSGKPSSPQKRKTFPAASIPHSLWRPRDSEGRDRAYLSGFMANLASTGRLDDAALKWTFDSVLKETSDNLQRAYLDCVSVGSLNWTRANVTPGMVQQVFAELGAEDSSIRDGAEIEPRLHVKWHLQYTDTKGILAAVHLFYVLCQDMDFASLSKLTSTIARLCLDQDVMSDGRVSQAIEDLLAKLADLSEVESREHVHERLISDLGTNLTDAILQDRFLSHFIPTSRSGAELRIKLASIFLLGSKLAQKATAKKMKHLLTALTSHVSQPPTFSNTYLASTNGPDYTHMTASVGILDAAIADGHQHFAFSEDSISVASDVQRSLMASKAEEAMFNTNVDKLADKLRDLFTGIADSGASHMRRTEAKDAIQALYYRLLHSVRTKPRRKKHVFDPQNSSRKSKGFLGGMRDVDDVLEESRGKDFMARFLKGNKDQIVTGDNDEFSDFEIKKTVTFDDSRPDTTARDELVLQE